MEIVSKNIELQQMYAGHGDETKQYDHLEQNEGTL